MINRFFPVSVVILIIACLTNSTTFAFNIGEIFLDLTETTWVQLAWIGESIEAVVVLLCPVVVAIISQPYYFSILNAANV